MNDHDLNLAQIQPYSNGGDEKLIEIFNFFAGRNPIIDFRKFSKICLLQRVEKMNFKARPDLFHFLAFLGFAFLGSVD